MSVEDAIDEMWCISRANHDPEVSDELVGYFLENLEEIRGEYGGKWIAIRKMTQSDSIAVDSDRHLHGFYGQAVEKLRSQSDAQSPAFITYVKPPTHG